MNLFDFFILRTPLLPADTDIEHPVLAFSENSLIREAILISSPVLFAKTNALLTGGIIDPTEAKKIERSLRKYLKRLRGRCTPFGISAGVTIGSFSDRNEILLQKYSDIQRYQRADMGVLCEIQNQLIKDKLIQSYIRYYPNNTIYGLGKTKRYIEYEGGSERSYKLSGFVADETLDSILHFCNPGRTFKELNSEFSDFEDDALTQFLDELVHNKILISEIEPNVNGDFYGSKLSDFLQRIPVETELKSAALQFLKAVSHADPNEPFTIEKYHCQKRLFNSVVPDSTAEDLVQFDVYKPSAMCNLDRSLFSNLQEAYKLVFTFNTGRTTTQNRNQTKFVAEFEKRYEGKEIQLMVALDPDAGIGYPPGEGVKAENELIAGLTGSEEQNVQFHHSPIFDMILHRFQECIASGTNTLELTENDYKQFASEPILDGCVSSLVSVIGAGENRKILHIASEPSGINVASRFAHMPMIKERLDEVCQRENDYFENKDILVAEVSILPKGRIANIVYKPMLRDYEIPIISQSAAEKDKVISLDDLLISIRNGQIVLRSRSRNKFVIPKFSCVYDHYKLGLPILSFLADYRFQFSPRPINWMWGTLTRMKFLPRVTYKNVILSRAQWYISLDKFGDLTSSNIRITLSKEGVPIKFCIALDDNVLPINTDSVEDLEVFIEELRRYKRLTIVEDVFQYELDDYLVRGTDGSFRNEIILMWDNFKNQRVQKLTESYEFRSQKEFLPGGEWMYWKIYCGERAVDHVLVDVLFPVLDQLSTSGEVKKWFFIRYADPDFHIRIRLLVDENSSTDVQKRFYHLYNSLLQENMIWRVQQDTYCRELIRYGDKNINNAESLFHIDSLFICRLIRQGDAPHLQNNRWKVALLAVDQLLTDFGLDLEGKIVFTEKSKHQFFANLKISNKDIEFLKSNARKYKTDVEFLLTRRDNDFHSVYDLLQARAISTKPVVVDIMNLYQKSELQIPLQDLLLSLTHMCCNRIFVSQHKLHEAAIYDILNIYYKSSRARAEKAQKKTALDLAK